MSQTPFGKLGRLMSKFIEMSQRDNNDDVGKEYVFLMWATRRKMEGEGHGTEGGTQNRCNIAGVV